MTTTTARKTIARSHTRRIAALREKVARATVSDLGNQFIAEECPDPQAVITEWQGHEFSRLTEDVPGEKWTVHVHGNRWYTLYAAPAEAERPASDEEILEHVAESLSRDASNALTTALPADDDVTRLVDPAEGVADELLAAGLVELVDGQHELTRLGLRLADELADPGWAAWMHGSDEQPADEQRATPAPVQLDEPGRPVITDPNLTVVKFDDEKPDNFGRRRFTAYWFADNIGPNSNQTGTRGQVFCSHIASWLAQDAAEGKTVVDLETGEVLAEPVRLPDPEPDPEARTRVVPATGNMIDLDVA